MKQVLVAGAGGMIGSALVKKLKREGHWVRGVDLKYPEFSKSPADEFILSDMRDPQQVREAMQAPDQYSLMDSNSFAEVYALCAQMGGASYIFTGENDSEILYDSCLMNLHIAHYASMFKVKKLLFTSSACCYSEEAQTELNSPALKESSAWQGKPDSPYGIEKLMAEEVYSAYARNHGLNIRIARLHNIFSPECSYKDGREKAPAALCRKVSVAKDEIEIFGDGEQKRSFLFIDECLKGMELLMESDYTKPLNIGSDFQISINDLARMIIKISGKELRLKHIESNALGVRGRNSDNTLLEATLGWKPSKPLEEGITILYNWIKNEINRDGLQS